MSAPNSYPHKAVCRFDVSAWSEQPVIDVDGAGTTRGDVYYPDRGVTRAEVGYAYRGELEGTSTTAYLITYKSGAAPVVGLEHFEGSVAGHKGTFVLRHLGEQHAGTVRAHLEVVPGMGTGALANLRGEADLLIEGHSEDGYELVLRYDLR